MTSLILSRSDLVQLIARVCLHLPLRLSKVILPLAGDISKILTTGQGEIQFDLRDSDDRTYGHVRIDVHSKGRS